MTTAADYQVTPMDAEEFREALDWLGFGGQRVANDLGVSDCARFFGVSLRAAQKWAAEGPPNTVAVCLRLMLAAQIDADQARELLPKPGDRRRRRR